MYFNFKCYYLGGVEDSATGILSEMSKPLSWSMPADKICEKLKKKDNQICDLRYGNYCFHFLFSSSVKQGISLKNFLKFYREADWLENCQLEETESARLEENLEWLGRNMRWLHRKGWFHQENRVSEAEICQGRIIKRIGTELGLI